MSNVSKTPFELRRRATDTVAIILIKAFSIFTIAFLVLIIGYISYRAFVTDRRYDTEVIPSFSSSDIPIQVVSHKENQVQALSYPVLRDLYDGKIFSLRRISAVDRDVILYIESGMEKEVLSYLNLTERSLQRSEVSIVSKETLLSLISSRPGAIAIVSDQLATQKLPRTVQSIVVEDMVLAVHPSVVELRGNRRLQNLDQKMISDVLQGSYASWSEIGGHDIPIVLVENPSDILHINGAVAAIPYIQAEKENIPILKVNAREVKRNIRISYIFQKPVESGKYGGISTIIGNTLLMVILTIIVAGPIGIGAATFLVEYPKNRKLLSIIRTGVDLLAGVPSIIFGLFGLLVFVQLAGWSFSLMSGAMTISIMILPTIIRTSEEAIRSVDRSLREASIALGATKIETIWKVVIPAASPGITTGIILAIGRAVGETAALIYTIGSGTEFATGLLESARVLAMHIFLTITEGQSFDRAFASAFILIILVLFINIIARLSARRLFTHGSH